MKARYIIGGHWFDVRYKGETDAYTMMGSKFTWWNLIILQRDMKPSKQMSNLFHEVLHEIDTQNTLGLSEGQVSCISEAFYAFLSNNDMLKEEEINGFAGKSNKGDNHDLQTQ